MFKYLIAGFFGIILAYIGGIISEKVENNEMDKIIGFIIFIISLVLFFYILGFIF